MYGDALTTIARIKDRLGITVATFDSLLQNLILSVTARIEQMTGRRYVEGTYTNELHNGSDLYGTRRKFLIVKNAPLQIVSSVQYKGGTNSNPVWTTMSVNDYNVDLDEGIIHMPGGMPGGMQNIRITYVGGFSGHSIGIDNFWTFNVVPTGTVNGTNLTFTLPENAKQVIVYADGVREIPANVAFTALTATFTLAVGRAPFSTIAVDYLRGSSANAGDINLPADLVETCEQAVVRIFKRRDSEGRASEGFQESQITWQKSVFTDEDHATIRNYRRGYNL